MYFQACSIKLKITVFLLNFKGTSINWKHLSDYLYKLFMIISWILFIFFIQDHTRDDAHKKVKQYHKQVIQLQVILKLKCIDELKYYELQRHPKYLIKLFQLFKIYYNHCLSPFSHSIQLKLGVTLQSEIDMSQSESLVCRQWAADYR